MLGAKNAVGLSRVRGQEQPGFLGQGLAHSPGTLTYTQRKVCLQECNILVTHYIHTRTNTCMVDPCPIHLCILLGAPGKQPNNTHYTHRRKDKGTHIFHAGGHRARDDPEFKARANISQPHLPDLNGPQSGSRNKTKGWFSLLPTHHCPHTIPPLQRAGRLCSLGAQSFSLP